MIKSLKILLVVGIFLLSSLCIIIPAQANSESTNVNINYPAVYYFGYNTGSYSVNYNESSSVINFYVTYMVSSYLHVVNGSNSLGVENVYPVSDFINSSSNISQSKYFISNNTQFIALSSNIANNYSLSIFALNTNQSIVFQGITSYKISLINTFNDSLDVYFSFYNTTQFSIVKYNFEYNNFTIFYQTKNLKYDSYSLSKVNVFYLQNKIYSSLAILDNTTFSQSYNSSILLFNESTSIFNRTFNNFLLSFFTPTDSGFLLYSSLNGRFYDYRFLTNKYPITSTYFPSIDSLKPFSNNSFLFLSSGNLYKSSIILYSNSSSINYSYFSSVNGYNLNLNTIHLATGNYYILGGYNMNTNNYLVSINTEFDSPNGFLPISTTTSTNPFPQYGTSTTQYAVTTSSVSSSGLGIFFFILLIIFGIIGVALYSSNQKNRNRYYPPRNSSYLNRPNNSSQNYYSNSSKPLANSFCSSCGSKTEPGDIFCQNCGNRL